MRHLLALILAICMSSTTWSAPTPDAFDLAAQPQVHVVHSESGRPFNFGSAPGAMNPFLMIAILPHAFESESMKAKLGLKDPVPYAKEALAEGLRRALQLGNLSVVQETMSAAALNSLRQKNASGLLLEIATEYWGLEGYRAKYHAEAKLTSLADSSVLWTGSCPAMLSNTVDHKKMQPASEEEAKALEESLLADNGALIKSALRESANRCGGVIARQLLKPKPRARVSSENPWPTGVPTVQPR